MNKIQAAAAAAESSSRKTSVSISADIERIISELSDEAIRVLRELISIRSTAGEPEENAPFGKGVQQAYEYMLKLAGADGFDVETAGNYGGHIEFGGYLLDENGEITGVCEETLGILCHLDVVPEGKGWSCDPYIGKVENERIYGRGAIDNKGPTVACYFAMKVLKLLGFVPERKTRLILGLDEETGWDGMNQYLLSFKAPDIGFTPDAEFPAINGEKGILTFALARKMEKPKSRGLLLRSIKGGNAPNMTPDFARAVVRGDHYEVIKTKASEYRKKTGYEISIKGIGKSLEITTKGISAHGAQPEKGLNAISILFDFLSGLVFASESVNDFIYFYNHHIGFELNGSSLGCGFCDEPSGNLVLNAGMISGDDKALKLTINVRYPVTVDQEQVYDSIMPIADKFDLGLIKLLHHDPIFFPADSELIKTLVSIYRKHTGDMDSEPKVIGGGTFARAAKNIAAFGADFPGVESTAHQKDEYIGIEHFLKLIRIYADAIIELSYNV